MRAAEKFKSYADAGTVHGATELFNCKTEQGRAMWFGCMLLSLCMLISVLFNVSRQFYTSEPISSASFLPPETFPFLYICPAKIPMSVLQTAGYTGISAKLLQNIPSLGTHNRNYEEVEAEEGSSRSAFLTDLTVQEILTQVGQSHLAALNVTIRGSMAEMLETKSEAGVVLTSSGYCISTTTAIPNRPLAELTARFLAMTVRIGNGELISEMGGFFVAVRYHKNEAFLPSPRLFQLSDEDTSYSISARWERKISLKSAAGNCGKNWHSRDHCLATCLSNMECDTECVDASACVRKTLNSTKCTRACKKPCNQELFTHIVTQSSDLATNSRSNESMRLIKFNLIIDSPGSSLTTEEAPFVTFSMYFVYVGGNLGVFFGINVLGILSLIKMGLLRRRSRKSRMQLQKASKFFTPLLMSIAMAPFAISLSKDYFIEQKTTVQLYSKTDNVFPKIFIVGPGVSERKLKSLLNLENAFWMEEDERQRMGEDELPFMCDLVNGFQWASPMLKEFDTMSPKFVQRVANLSAILSNDVFVKTHGLQKLLVDSADDASGLFRNVSDALGRQVSYTAKTVLASPLLMSELQIHDNDTSPALVQHSTYYSILTNQASLYENKCRVKREWRGLVAANDHETIGFLFDFLPYPRVGDASILVGPINMRLKNRRSRACVQNKKEYIRCKISCMDRLRPCTCGVLGYDMGSENTKNVSDICHHLQPIYRQCPLARVIDTESVGACERECAKPCEHTHYSLSANYKKAKNPGFQELGITLDNSSKNLHLKESYAYDIVVFLCNLGGLFSFFCGYSFITLFETLSRQDKRKTMK